MPRRFSSLLRSAMKSTPATTTTSALDKSLKNFASPLDDSSASTPKHTIFKSHKRPQPSKPPSPVHLSSLVVNTSSCSDSDGFSADFLDSEGDNGGKPSEDASEVPWFSDLASYSISLRQKALSRGRKQEWVFKKGLVDRVNRFSHSWVERLGTAAALNVIRKLGGEIVMKEFNALLKICIETARTTDDWTVALEQVSTAFEVFISMKEQGFPIEEESYGQVLLYLIGRGMVEQFHLFTDVIKDGNASTVARLGYYEMLLYIKVNDEEKISVMLETLDITQISSLDHIVNIFQSLGRLSLESHAEKFLLALKKCDVESEDILGFIISYATSIPNLTVEDVLLRFKNLHTVIEMTPSSRSYTKLVKHSCGLPEMHVAFDVVHQMCKAGLSLSMDIIHTLLNATEKSSEFYLVERIYSLICHYDLKPNYKTFRQLISLSVKMNDVDGAYGMLNDLKKLNLAPTAIMYNAIIGGYFREKRFSDVSKVVNQMKLAHVKLAHVKPDSITYAYLKQLQQRRESH